MENQLGLYNLTSWIREPDRNTFLAHSRFGFLNTHKMSSQLTSPIFPQEASKQLRKVSISFVELTLGPVLLDYLEECYPIIGLACWSHEDVYLCCEADFVMIADDQWFSLRWFLNKFQLLINLITKVNTDFYLKYPNILFQSGRLDCLAFWMISSLILVGWFTNE